MLQYAKNLSTLLLCFFAWSSCYAGDVANMASILYHSKLADSAAKSGDKKTAFAEAKTVADMNLAGDSDPRTFQLVYLWKAVVGIKYASGDGVEKSLERAGYYFQASLDKIPSSERVENKSVLLAEYLYGLMLFNGTGVPEDKPKAAKWLREPAESGDADAQESLANMSFAGQGTPQDFEESLRLYKLAAKTSPQSAFMVGRQFAEGKGTTRNRGEAIGWLTAASDKGNTNAMAYLGYQFLNHDNVLAYALLNAASGSGLAETIRKRDELSNQLDVNEIAQGQALTREITSGNTAKAIGSRPGI